MPEKKGLKPEHHGDLNRPSEVYPGGQEARAERIGQLRKEYEGDTRAQQQIDIYEPGNEYHRRVYEYREALMNGNLAKQKELEAWFNQNYPDIGRQQ
jgi:hypothetical protein